MSLKDLYSDKLCPKIITNIGSNPVVFEQDPDVVRELLYLGHKLIDKFTLRPNETVTVMHSYYTMRAIEGDELKFIETYPTVYL